MEMSATNVFCGHPEERKHRCGTSLQPCPLSWGWDKSWQTLPAPCSFSWCLTIKSDMWEVISKSLTWEKYLARISLLNFMYSSEIFSVVSWIYFSHLSYGLIRDGNWWPLLLNLSKKEVFCGDCHVSTSVLLLPHAVRRHAGTSAQRGFPQKKSSTWTCRIGNKKECHTKFTRKCQNSCLSSQFPGKSHDFPPNVKKVPELQDFKLALGIAGWAWVHVSTICM